MQKRIIYIGIICLALFFCSCSSPTTSQVEEEKQKQEIQILDENLDLKIQVAELQEDVERLENYLEKTALAEEDVYRFFQAVKHRNIAELKRRVTDNAQLDASGIIFKDGQSLKFEKQIPHKSMMYIRLKEEASSLEEGELVYEILPETNSAAAEYLQVEMIRQNDIWKVSSFSSESL